jgi:hypothetical protein
MYDQTKTGNDRFDGVSIDVLNEFCILSGCSLVFEIADKEDPADLDIVMKTIGKGGSPVTTDLVAGAVEIGFSETYYAFFTQPYINTGLVVVIPTPTGRIFDTWSLLTPFSL